MSNYVVRKYEEFYNKYGYISKMFEPYNGAEIVDVAPTILANSNSSTANCGTVLIVVKEGTD